MIKNYLLFACLICLMACRPSGEGEAEKKSEGIKTSSNEDHFPHKVSLKYARHFSVTYHNHYKVVKTNATFYIDDEINNGDDRNDVLVLVQKGTTPPPLEGELENAQVISVPVETVAVNVQHSESFLRELGLIDHITAIGGLYSYDDEMRGKALNGELGHVGYSWHSPPNMEVLLERAPELFLMTLASMDHIESLEKCRQLAIPTAAVFDWAEQDYLARAEWLKFYSLFFNAEEAANREFEKIESRIEELKQMVADKPKESAIWGYYSSKSRWVMQLSSFPAQYLRDANLNNVLLEEIEPNADGIQVLTTEQLLVHGKEASHWVIGDIHAAPLPEEKIMSSFASWREEKLYHNMKRVDPKSNTSDWYATAIVRPDLVLSDLIKLIHPDLLPDHQPLFLGLYDKLQ